MKKLLGVILPILLILTGCQTTSNTTTNKNEAVSALLSTDTNKMQYSYRNNNELSKKIMVEKSENEAKNTISIKTIDSIKEGFKTLNLIEDVEQNLKEDNLIYIIFPTKETVIYIYQDGMIKTVSNYKNRNFYKLENSETMISEIQSNIDMYNKSNTENEN